MATKRLIEEKCDRCGATQCSDADAQERNRFVIDVEIAREQWAELCSPCLEELRARTKAFMEEKMRKDGDQG